MSSPQSLHAPFHSDNLFFNKEAFLFRQVDTIDIHTSLADMDTAHFYTASRNLSNVIGLGDQFDVFPKSL